VASSPPSENGTTGRTQANGASRLTCAPEPTRGIAGHGVALHAGLAHVNTLVQLPRVIARVTLGDAGTLRFAVLYFLRT
jgi:hypothetical protein